MLGGDGAEPGDETGADHEAEAASEGGGDISLGPDDVAQGLSQGITLEDLSRLSAAQGNIQRLWLAVAETALLHTSNLMQDEHLDRFLANVPADIRPEKVARISS